MRCYYHDDAEAVGICKNCQRGICRSCAASLPNGLACRDRCEAQVAAVNALVERAQITGGRRGAFFLVAVGGVMTLIGLITLRSGWPFVVLGLLFIWWGIPQLRRRPQPATQKPSA